jgi:hypothetical protein
MQRAHFYFLRVLGATALSVFIGLHAFALLQLLEQRAWCQQHSDNAREQTV